MASDYGWCHTAQCVAEWSWGQNANNLFTLLGAIATFIAAFLALLFSTQEARRQRVEDMTRARVAAIANLHTIREMATFANRLVAMCIEVRLNPGIHQLRPLVDQLIRFADTAYDEISDADLLLLASLPDEPAFRIARGYAAFSHLKDQRNRLVTCDYSTDEAQAMASTLIESIKNAGQDFDIAAMSLLSASKF